MKPGKYYLFICPFFMTYVGRYVRHLGPDIVIDHGIYFQFTGRTFGELCRKGLMTTGEQAERSKFDELNNGSFIPAQGSKIPWLAATPWAEHEGHPDE